MFSSSRSKNQTDSFSKHRAGKSTSKSKKSFRDQSTSRRPAQLDLSSSNILPAPARVPDKTALTSAIITLSIGQHPPRLFAAHVDVLNSSPFFQSALRSQYYNSESRQLLFPDEVPEVFSSVLEFLYKGDYSPKLICRQSNRGTTWTLDTADQAPGTMNSTVWIPGAIPASPNPSNPVPPASPTPGTLGAFILKDTAVYCAAEKYSLPQLKRLALRKQGLQAGIPVATIISSAKYAYGNTPENDSKLRAHYLALIIRSRNTFKKSGTMQVEMGAVSPVLTQGGFENEKAAGGMLACQGAGTGLWFDLFVAMCNHLDDMEQIVAKSPR